MQLYRKTHRNTFWVALLDYLSCGNTNCKATNLTTSMPLTPFQIWVEWTISSPDVLNMALVEYLETNTIAENITLVYNTTVDIFEVEPERMDFTFTGIAEAAINYGAMTRALLQQEQRMILANTAELELFVQVYYDKAIRPFNGSINVLFVQLLFPDEREVPHSENDMRESNNDSLYSSAWFILVVALAAAAFSAILMVVTVGFVKTRVQRWRTRLNDWKYHLDRERNLIPPPPIGVDRGLASVTMNSSNPPNTANEEGDIAAASPTGDRHETTSFDP